MAKARGARGLMKVYTDAPQLKCISFTVNGERECSGPDSPSNARDPPSMDVP